MADFPSFFPGSLTLSSPVASETELGGVEKGFPQARHPQGHVELIAGLLEQAWGSESKTTHRRRGSEVGSHSHPWVNEKVPTHLGPNASMF